MKKLLVLALVVFGAVASQAVTYTWDSTSNTFKDSSGSLLYAYSGITSLKITLDYENANASSSFKHDYFAITGNATSGENGLLKLSVASSSSSSSGVAQLTISSTSGTTTLTDKNAYYNANRAAKDKVMQTTFTFGGLTNGVFTKVTQDHLFTYIGESLTEQTTFSGQFDFNEKVLNSITVYSGARVLNASIEIEGEPLPEPGVLALLALGVAGLALRRKVA